MFVQDGHWTHNLWCMKQGHYLMHCSILWLITFVILFLFGAISSFLVSIFSLFTIKLALSELERGLSATFSHFMSISYFTWCLFSFFKLSFLLMLIFSFESSSSIIISSLIFTSLHSWFVISSCFFNSSFKFRFLFNFFLFGTVLFGRFLLLTVSFLRLYFGWLLLSIWSAFWLLVRSFKESLTKARQSLQMNWLNSSFFSICKRKLNCNKNFN